jgi:cytochrome d ubiquinol oxidase subunit I
VVAALGAYYVLHGEHLGPARLFLRIGITAGLASSLITAFPTGDIQAKLVARHKPAALAAMEGRFESGTRAEITIIGQPNVRERKLDNPIQVPGVLSFLAYGHFYSNVRGLDEFPETDWPDNIELLYYAFHIMGASPSRSGSWRWRTWLGSAWRRASSLWVLMLSFPLHRGVRRLMTTELGRQPWLVYGCCDCEGSSPTVHPGTVLFTLIGFCGLYTVLGLLFLYLIAREIARGPGEGHA